MVPGADHLLKLLSNHDVTFFIPPFQRNYEWDESECEKFFNDVVKTTESNINGRLAEHFFGSVTYYGTSTPFGQPDKLVLIDGQQRITTTMLFLAAIRDTLSKDDKLVEFINNKYLKNEDVIGDYEYKIKLKQAESDWAPYKSIILNSDSKPVYKGSAIYNNYRYFLGKLKTYDGQVGDLVEMGLAKFSIITIELEPAKHEWENPQEIFESMNSTGKPLSLADLVRNYLLMGQSADDMEALYNDYWLPMEEAVSGHASDFIRDFMQAREKRSFLKATEGNYQLLYGLFKQLFPIRGAKGVLKELSEYAPIYAYFVKDESCGNTRVDRQIQDLKMLNITTAYSFLMELFMTRRKGTLSDSDMYQILDAFRTYCLRKRLLGVAAAENKNFPTLAAKIPELVRATDKRAAMFIILSRQEYNLRLPNDTEMDRGLHTMNFANFRYCKFYLALVEERLTKSRPSLNDPLLQLEHILPQTITDAWRKELGGDNPDDVQQALVNSIGNLTLIRHNQELGNKPFSFKRNVYENHAGLQIAKTMITNQKVWDADAINARADWLIDYILQEVLPIPDKMRKTNNFLVKEGKSLSFERLGLIGKEITYIKDPDIVARVVSDKEVEFEGKTWKLSPLTKELHIRQGTVSSSGSYQGAAYWQYDGMRLVDIM